MTKLIVAFRYFATEPKNEPLHIRAINGEVTDAYVFGYRVLL
jgi:hypothetical protein